MDVLDHLIEEHRKVEQLLDTLKESDAGPEREAALSELEDSLATHMAVEETFVYPIVEEAFGDKGDEDVKEADNEHQLAREGLGNMRDLVAEPGFGAAVDMVKAGLEHHVEEEETDLFPRLREKANDKIKALGDPEVLEAKVATKAELFQKASEADIAGRSTMTKDELAEAVVKTS